MRNLIARSCANVSTLQPQGKFLGLGSSLFARRYLGNKLLFSFSPGTEMFHFPGYALLCLMHKSVVGLPQRVAPFGNPRIIGCYTPTRGLSQLRHVLHRQSMSRHPPYTLIALLQFLPRETDFIYRLIV